MKWLVVALVALAGCENYDEVWPVRAGLATQSVARADLGLAPDADITAGSLWVSLHDYGETDIAYPMLDAGGGRLTVTSPFDPTVTDPRDALESSTSIENADGQNDGGHTQYVTLYLDVQLADHLRDRASGALATGILTLTIELEAHMPKPCDPPPDQLRGTVESTEAKVDVERRGDGAYLAGPFALAIAIEPQYCVE